MKTLVATILEGLEQTDPHNVGLSEEHLAAYRLANAAPELRRALEIISNITKCQCVETHGDNPHCAVLIAETAIAKTTKGE